MIRLAGKQVGKDIAVIYTGLRPGEKLHETLFHADESYRPTAHPKILQAEQRSVAGAVVAEAINRLQDACTRYDQETLAAVLRQAVPEFVPVAMTHHADNGTIVAFPARAARKI